MLADSLIELVELQRTPIAINRYLHMTQGHRLLLRQAYAAKVGVIESMMDNYNEAILTDGWTRLDAVLTKVRDAEAILKNMVDFADLESSYAGDDVRCLLAEHYLRYDWVYNGVSSWLSKVVDKLPGNDARQRALLAQSAFMSETVSLTSCKHLVKSAVLDPRTSNEQLPFLLHNLAVLNYSELMLWHERANSSEGDEQDEYFEDQLYEDMDKAEREKLEKERVDRRHRRELEQQQRIAMHKERRRAARKAVAKALLGRNALIDDKPGKDGKAVRENKAAARMVQRFARKHVLRQKRFRHMLDEKYDSQPDVE